MTIERLAREIGEPAIVIPPYAPQWRVALMKLPGGGSVSGKGETESAARASCFGEAAEILSAQRQPQDRDFLATDLATQNRWSVDAATVTIADKDDANDPGTEGCAAGTDLRSAIAGALLERIERHAVARWWLGHAPAHRLSTSRREFCDVGGMVHQGRQGARKTRTTRLFLLEGIAGITTIVACSSDELNQLPVIGVAASWDPAQAVRSAFAELVQMEFGLVLAIEAARRGELQDQHRALLRRCQLLETQKAALLNPQEMRDFSPTKPPHIAEIAAAIGGRVWWADLTRKNIGVPVVRVVAENLTGARRLKFGPDGGPL